MTTKKKQSTRRGASIERSVLIRKIRRMKKAYALAALPYGALLELEEWIDERVPRFKSKKGGL